MKKQTANAANGKLLVCFVIVLFILFFSITHLSAQETDVNKIETGTFFLKNVSTGEIKTSMTLKTDVLIKVTGIVIRGKVVQQFTNQSDQWMEGIYMFPLPETAAVDTLFMKIGSRIIEGEIKEKQEAKAIYETAKAEGKKASLLEQERPNIFNASVANIGPGETIEVMIEYQQSVDYDNGQYSITFPMTVGPRYIPLSMYIPEPENTSKHPEMTTDPKAITAPIDFKATADYPVSLRIELDTGFKAKEVDSPYLPVNIVNQAENKFIIVPKNNTSAKRSDFVLTWKPENLSETYTSVFQEEVNGELYSLFMIHPRSAETITTSVYKREVIIILDTSGSMQGESIKQAKKALLTSLDRLNENDIFNIIEFNSTMSTLFTQSVAVNTANISKAIKFVAGLAADNGTEMFPAIQKALSGNRDPERLFQVIFITDGCVGNEAELFTYIKKEIGNGRLFTVGIGSAPNRYFMRKAALVGKGTYLYIAAANEVQDKMDTLFKKIANPVLTDISLAFSNTDTVTFPDPIPDLYAGEPLTIVTRSRLNSGTLKVTGYYGNKAWEESFVLQTPEKNTGIGKTWANRNIENLMDGLLEGKSEETIKLKVIPIALEHHLVSQYTSLVAVEQVRSKPDDAQAGSEKLKQALPKGWEMSPAMPGTGTELWFYILIGMVLIVFSLTGMALLKKGLK